MKKSKVKGNAQSYWNKEWERSTWRANLKESDLVMNHMKKSIVKEMPRVAETKSERSSWRAIIREREREWQTRTWGNWNQNQMPLNFDFIWWQWFNISEYIPGGLTSVPRTYIVARSKHSPPLVKHFQLFHQCHWLSLPAASHLHMHPELDEMKH